MEKKKDFLVETDIDIKDLAMWMVRYWLVIVLALFLGAMAVAGVAFYKNCSAVGQTAEEVTAQKRAVLTENRATEVEQLLANYCYYFELLKNKSDERIESEHIASGDESDEFDEETEKINAVRDMVNMYSGQISRLNQDEKEYYDSLIDESDRPAAKISITKALVMGGICGVMGACVVLVMIYVFLPYIKTSNDLEFLYAIPVLSRLDTKTANGTQMLATDIAILMDKRKKNKLFFSVDKNDKEMVEKAEAVAVVLKETSKETIVHLANPIADTDALREMAECDAVVTFVKLKKTERKAVSDIVSYCKRYDVDVLGFVTV